MWPTHSPLIKFIVAITSSVDTILPFFGPFRSLGNVRLTLWRAQASLTCYVCLFPWLAKHRLVSTTNVSIAEAIAFNCLYNFLFWGHFLSFWLSHGKPFHKSNSYFKSEPNIPLKSNPVGFSPPGQYPKLFRLLILIFHSHGTWQIVSTPTSFSIQHRAVLLSSQYLTLPNFMSCYIAFNTEFMSCAKILADINSNLGIVSTFDGATRHLNVSIVVY